ncbi:hypothetical protein CRI93_08475 [Longimonas halophila]|uniref:DUF2851 domain-containing protein n=1 Tax=Longimonas halophila TaxID=1469170 RepID=A0A2H3NSI2_9BACT|nr:DUF2851 family protein [Longimonas halophila]PEN06671.1 hypothetical protein CRI93_08475 [Longimonas halophila]
MAVSRSSSSPTSNESPPAYVHTRAGQRVAVTLHEPEAPLAERVPEAFVQDLWAQQHLNTDRCQTVDGAPVQVLSPGMLNTDAGPDFRDAHLRIGDVTWHGDVEIHNQSHGWRAHQHQDDPRYNSVVLHVTLTTDMWTGRLTRADGSPLPELVLERVLNQPLRAALHRFLTRTETPIVCAAQWPQVDATLRSAWMRELGHKRLQHKADALDTPLEDALFERLCAGMGYAKNDGPMSDLAARCPLALLQPLPDASTIEAALLGWAGLLPDPATLAEAERSTVDYVMHLRDRFRRMRSQHDARPLPAEQWTFFRLRPNNFPALRLAQVAQWVAPGGWLRSDPLGALDEAVRDPNPKAALHDLLSSTPGDFWTMHRRLDRTSKPYDPTLGTSRRNTLILNALVPVLMRKARTDASLRNAIDRLLQHLPAASDRITRLFRDLDTHPQNAVEAQGAHQLYRTLCQEGRCLQCAVGQAVLMRNS